MRSIFKFVSATFLILAIAASSFRAIAQSNTPVYDRKANSRIGILTDNASGYNYEIKDRKGNVVMNGRIRHSKFYIPTEKLNKGSYQFTINGILLQEFVIK